MANTSMTDLVLADKNGELRTTTEIIARETDTAHASVIKLVRRYQSDLEEFGRVGFEIQPFATEGGTQKREISLLNEQQATLLLTYMRNSDIVRVFKKRLVHEFYRMRDAIAGKIKTASQVEVMLAECMQQLTASNADLKRSMASFGFELKEVKDEVGGIRTDLDGFKDEWKAEIIDIKSRLVRRDPFKPATQSMFRNTVKQRYQGMCPCCQKVQILDKHGLPIKGVAQLEHFNGRNKTAPTDGWIVCRKCNIELEWSRPFKRTAFDRFQQIMSEIYGSREQLDLFRVKTA